MGAATVAGAATVMGIGGLAGAETITPVFSSNPFKFGAASSPLKNVLWTRLAINPFASDGRGGMPMSGDVPVDWAVALDRDMTDVIAGGSTLAKAADSHSVHLEVASLPDGAVVFYQFRYGEYVSTVGRLVTAPDPGSLVTSLVNVALISCANFEHGYFHAYDAIAAEQVDLIVALSDFVYADSDRPHGSLKVRAHLPADQCFTLGDYRLRHSQYRLDAKEQALRASSGMIAIIDDHEIDNDWAAAAPEGPGSQGYTFWSRRGNGLQALWENMPFPNDMRPELSLMPNSYRTLHWGTLADFHLIDVRQPYPRWPFGASRGRAVGGQPYWHPRTIEHRCAALGTGQGILGRR